MSVALFLLLQTYATLTQMVALYQDPEGKMIFSRTDPSQSATKLTTDNESLKRRLQELENEVLLAKRLCF